MYKRTRSASWWGSHVQAETLLALELGELLCSDFPLLTHLWSIFSDEDKCKTVTTVALSTGK